MRLIKQTCLFVDAGGLVLAGGDVELDATPGGGGQRGDFGEQLRGAAAQGDESDAVRVEPLEPIIGGELRIEDQVARGRPVVRGSRSR